MNMEPAIGKVGFVWETAHFRRLDRMDYAMEIARFNGDLYGLVSKELVNNIMPTEGLNYLLDTAIRGQAQTSSWYIALFEGNYTPVLADTAAGIVAAATECTAYSESTRQAYTLVAASGGVLTNAASPAVFTMNATKTVYGGFITGASAKSATTSKLVSAAKFSASKSVESTDILQVTATITLTSS